jgi:AcrR family transcriptional regulator
MNQTMSSLSWRERKKLATRQALSWAALRLAVERGLGNVLIEDIAAAGSVSPRTFNNYFSSKQEAICALAVDRARRIGSALRERPANEPLWDAITLSVLDQYRGAAEIDHEWITGVRLVMSEPSLQGEYLKARAAMEHVLAEAIAERTGTSTARDLYPRLVASVVAAASDAAIDHWLHADPGTSLEALLLEALQQLAAGLPPQPFSS